MRALRIWVVTAGWIALAAALVVFAGGPASLLSRPATVSAAETHGLNPADLDLTCKPCQDFFQYATGGWIAHNPIQPAYPSYGRFNELQNQNQLVLKQILEAAARDKHATPGSITQKIGDFYGSCMDTERIEADGLKPIEPELARVAALSNLAQLEDEVAHMQSQGMNALFRFGSTQDEKNSEQVIGIAMQGGLGLPDRDYYLKDRRSFQTAPRAIPAARCEDAAARRRRSRARHCGIAHRRHHGNADGPGFQDARRASRPGIQLSQARRAPAKGPHP